MMSFLQKINQKFQKVKLLTDTHNISLCVHQRTFVVKSDYMRHFFSLFNAEPATEAS